MWEQSIYPVIYNAVSLTAPLSRFEVLLQCRKFVVLLILFVARYL